MAKIRVYELAKKLGIPSARLIDELRALGVEVGSNFSTLDEKVMEKLGGGKRGPAKAGAPAAGAPEKVHPAPQHPKVEPAQKPGQPAPPPPPAPFSAQGVLHRRGGMPVRPQPAAEQKPAPAPQAAAPKPAAPPAPAPPVPGARPGTPAPQSQPHAPQGAAGVPAASQPAAGPRPATTVAAPPAAGPRPGAPVSTPPAVGPRPGASVTPQTATGQRPAAPVQQQPPAGQRPGAPVSAPPVAGGRPGAPAPVRPQQTAGQRPAGMPPAPHQPGAPRPAGTPPRPLQPSGPAGQRPPQSHGAPQGARPHTPGGQPQRPGFQPRPQGPRPGGPPPAGQGRPSHAPAYPHRPGSPAARGGAPGQPSTGHPPASQRPGYPPRPAAGAPAQPPARPGEAPRPAGRFAPTPEARRKTKRERRMEKLQARADRRERLDHEIEEARIQAETGEAVFIREGITVKELAEKLNVKVKDIIAKLMTHGIFATINQPLDSQIAIQVSSMFGFAAEVISYEDELVLTQDEAPEEDKSPRAPVVTVMGHVDHGKSSLLEAIHDVDITSKEFGGITQHIGAYRVRHKEREYVFLDTPGHEAFTLMRARGAQVTDIVILVVAADDGVMPQTVEAINHCKAASVPMVVAINKMDKPGADPDRVKRELSAQGILTEDWGGDVVSVPVSAKSRQGIEELLEMVSLVADMLNLKAAPDQPASGTVLESRLDRARGPVATVLIQDGSIGVGDLFLCGATYGHVRGMFDDKSNRLEKVGPSTPVEILGFPEVPAVGALFQGMADEARARQIASFRKEQDKAKALRTTKVRLDNVFGAIKQGEIEELPLILKADVQGSLEAIYQKVQEVTSDEVKMRVVHQGVGAISESDILLASASNALVIGFNVRPERKAVDLAKAEGVEIHLFTVIYDLMDRLKQALTGMLKPIQEEVVLGHAEVRDIFKISKVGTIAGCLVSDGRIPRTAQLRLLRDNVVVFTGKIASLKRFKDDASEVKEGLECGIGVENYNDLKPGDVLEAFEIHFQERTL